MLSTVKNRISKSLIGYLTSESRRYKTFSAYDTSQLLTVLEPGDVVLVEGDQRLSSAIKYLTQSTWSHAALYVGPGVVSSKYFAKDVPALIEADLKSGVTAIPLSKYSTFNTRICRAEGLSKEDQKTVVEYMTASLGMHYDLKNIYDLARYLLPHPPVPTRFRRQLIALGSGDPTRAICSSLIAQAFQLVRFPILPYVHRVDSYDQQLEEILQIRHHTLFAPRDFDLSPYFKVVKPAITGEFDYKKLQWQSSDDQTSSNQQTIQV